jgi:hypothetical protein
MVVPAGSGSAAATPTASGLFCDLSFIAFLFLENESFLGLELLSIEDGPGHHELAHNSSLTLQSRAATSVLYVTLLVLVSRQRRKKRPETPSNSGEEAA